MRRNDKETESGRHQAQRMRCSVFHTFIILSALCAIFPVFPQEPVHLEAGNPLALSLISMYNNYRCEYCIPVARISGGDLDTAHVLF